MNKSKMKVFLCLVLTLCIAIGVALTGCGGRDEPKEDVKPGADNNEKDETQDNKDNIKEEKATIRLLTRFSGTEAATPVWQEAIKEFMKRNPNVKIVDESVNQEAAYNNKIKTGLATGNMPHLFRLAGVVSQVKHAKNGIIMDIAPLMEDEEWMNGFFEGVFETWNFEPYGVKGYYGIPHAVASEVMLYNKELFAKAGIEKTPETMDELYDVIDKLKDIGVTPWACGAKSTWRAGHIHNYLLYKWAGVQKAIDLGTRKAKWTDPDVVQSLAHLKDLKERGAFMENFEGMDHDMEKVQFFSEQCAMMLNGSWFIGDCMNSDIYDKIGTFPFPYFKEKPEYRYHGVSFPLGFSLNGKMEGAEKQATIDFIKFWTGKEIQEKLVKEIQRLSSRKDLNLEGIELSKLYHGYNDILKDIKVSGGDSFNYDPLPAMQNRTRNSIVGMLLGNSPEEAAKEIQDEIDKQSE